MTENAVKESDSARIATPSVPSKVQQRAEAIVNPASGLANDYLNLFNEIVMLIEQLPTMPELIEDIMQWRPVTYQDYFAKSILPGRTSALEAYAALDGSFRRDFEAVVSDLDRRAVGAVVAIRRQYKTTGVVSPQSMADLCERAGETLREVLLKATSLVNHGTRTPRESEQTRADRLLNNSKLRHLG